MKNITLVVLLTLVSCGKQTVNKYIENPYDNSANEVKFKELDQRLSKLELSILNTIETMEENHETILRLQSQLSDEVNSLESDLSDVEKEVQTLGLYQESLQTIVTSLQDKQAELQLNTSVIDLIDPCPTVNSSSYKEMLFRLSNRKLVAYFEDGGKRFLTVLTAGNYETTDKRACKFTVDNNNNIR